MTIHSAGSNQISFTSCASVLDKLASYRGIAGVDIKYKPTGILRTTQIMLIDHNEGFAKAIDTFGRAITDFKDRTTTSPCSLNLKPWDFKLYKDFVENIPALKKLAIRGIVGQGYSSSAFLTAEDETIKLSTVPNFPYPDDFVPGLEVPVIGSYTSNNGRVYGVKEPFAEIAAIRYDSDDDNAKSALNSIWDNLYNTLKEFNERRKKTFSFDFDFQRGQSSLFTQTGFINNNSHLLDHGSIKGRNLVGQD